MRRPLVIGRRGEKNSRNGGFLEEEKNLLEAQRVRDRRDDFRAD